MLCGKTEEILTAILWAQIRTQDIPNANHRTESYYSFHKCDGKFVAPGPLGYRLMAVVQTVSVWNRNEAEKRAPAQ
jgi:hypothetical protein